MPFSLSVLPSRQNFFFSSSLRRRNNYLVRAAWEMREEEVSVAAGGTMVMSIPSIFKSERHASSSNMWSKRTEMSNGRSLGSSGMTSCGSRSTMVSLLVSLTNMHVFWCNLWRPFLMVLCIVILACLVQVMTWSPKASMFFPHVQRSRCWGHRGSRSFRFSITVNSSFGRRFLGFRWLILVRDADILGSKRSSSWDKVSTSLLDSRTRQSKTFRRLDATLLICSLHLLADDRSRKKES